MADNKTASQYAAQRSNEFYKKIIRKDATYARAYNSDHQMSLVERLLELLYNRKVER